MKKMRKISFAGIVALIVCLSFCFGAIPAAAVKADVTMEADAITVAANEENVYELTVWANSSTPFASYQVSLTLPSFARVDAVEALTNGQGDVFSGRGYGSTAAATLSSNVGKTGKVALFAVRFTVSGAAEGSYAVTANNLRVTNADAVELNAEFATTYMQVATPGQRIKGDWNGDGSVTLTDVMGIQQHIVNNMLGTPRTVVYEKFAAADIDGNGEINIVDCQYIQRYIIGAIDSLDNIGGHGSDDKEIVGIQAHYTGGEVMVGNPIPRDNIEVYLCYSDQSVERTYEFSIGDYDQTQAGTISVPVCYGKFSADITVTFFKPAPSLPGTYTGEAGTLKLYYNEQYARRTFGLQLNGAADEISGLFTQNGNTLYLVDGTNWYRTYIVTIDMEAKTFTLDKSVDYNAEGTVDYTDFQGTYTVADESDSIVLGQHGGFMRFEYDESGQVTVAAYTGTYAFDESGNGTAYVFGTDQDDCLMAVNFWITDTQNRVIGLEQPTFYQVQLFFYVDGELYRSPTATTPEDTSYSSLASWAAGFFYDMYPGDLNDEWDLVYPEGVTDDTLVEDGATVSLYFTTPAVTTYAMEITFYVDDEQVLTRTFEATAGSLYINTATEAAELFMTELYDIPLSDNWLPEYAEGVTNNTTVTGDDAFSLHFEALIYRVNVHLYVDGQLVDDQRYVTSPAFSTYYDVARVAARSYRERLKSYILSDEWDYEIPEDASADDLVADGSLIKIYYTSADTFYAVADDLPEIYPVLHFEADGTIALYDYDGTLLDAEFDTYEMLRKDGIVRAYITSFGNYMVFDGPSFVYGEGEDAVNIPILTAFRHDADEACTSYSFDFGPAMYRYDCYDDGFIDVYYRRGEDELAFTASTTYELNAEDGTIDVGGTIYTIGENNDLYIAVPETGFMFETPFPLWQDNTTLAVYDNGLSYRIYKGQTAFEVYPWAYVDENCIRLDIGSRYYRWTIDGQWHFESNGADVTTWDSTSLFVDENTTLTVYTNPETGVTVIYDGQRATYGMCDALRVRRDDYHNEQTWYLRLDDVAIPADVYTVKLKYNYPGTNPGEIFEYTGQLFLYDREEASGKARIFGFEDIYLFRLAFTYTEDTDRALALFTRDMHTADLVWNEEQQVFYVLSYDDLQYPVNVQFEKDGETAETTVDAPLFRPLVSSLLGVPVMLEGDATNYIVTGIYTDEDRTQAVADDYIFTDVEGALLFYLTVAECTPADIVGTAYELEPGARMDHPVILTGTVTGIQTNYNLYYHNVNVWLTVEGLEKYPILCYRLKATGFSIAPIAVGDVITVRGTLTNYNGTVEFASGCEVIDFQPAERPEEWDGTVTVDASVLGNEISDVRLYAWYYGCDDNPVAWPGALMTFENGVYTGAIDTELTLSGIVISWMTPDEKEHQTHDLFLPTSHVITLNATDVKN